MKILIKEGWVVDPSQNINGVLDILIEKGKIKKIDPNIFEDECEIIDAKGKYIVPGLIDMHVHFREPGFEDKEEINTGAHAAVAGGFSSVVCMPNTNPVIDNVKTIEYIHEKSKNVPCNIYMMGSITKGLEGKEMSPYEKLLEKGIVGITDDGKTVMDTKVMYEALQVAKDLDLLVSTHCEDVNLMYDRSIHRGYISKKLNLEGIPKVAEENIIIRDVFLSEKTGAKVHIQHLSTKDGVKIVRDAKKRGVRVTCEVTPHHFSIIDEEILSQGTNAKMSPPLRTKEDIDEILKGLVDGTIDVIATDHAPHTNSDKDKNIIDAANGIVGLETSLGIALTELVHTKKMTLINLIEKMSTVPAQILKLKKGSLKVGMDADITIIDLNKEWIVDKNKFFSKGKNTPFHGKKLKGKAVMTMVGGEIKYRD
ncbi:dihydroorotase [Anaerophilus nitritogenes]|uniref:dihydroorotase n=1 Tax=Anaerophilus nitritogenes TaxID=2498136 RepID=UPI00101D23D4|nr:dihydroorotase [Anaerophilus nitritogenes]